MIRPFDVLKRVLSLSTGKVHVMPVLVLMPHSRCNCRCIMCDIWKANARATELSADQVAAHVDDMRRLGVQRVVLSGGEALMHSDIRALFHVVSSIPAPITLLSTGLTLDRHVEAVATYCDEVIVSLDGSPTVHDAIRNVPGAFARLAKGTTALARHAPSVRITARCVLQRENYADVPNIIDAAHDLGLARLSFLAADLTSDAFNRPAGWDAPKVTSIGLTRDDVEAFEGVVERTLVTHADHFRSGFVAESPEGIRRLVRYYRAHGGDGSFPANRCNAPWVSAVVEADGSVRPCFFHSPLGSVHDRGLSEIINSPAAIGFRRSLDVKTNATCERCVCTLSLGLFTSV